VCHFGRELTGHEANFLWSQNTVIELLLFCQIVPLVGMSKGSTLWQHEELRALNCNRQFAQFNIEDDLESLYLPVKPDLPEGGKKLACPHCGRKATYQRTDLFYMR
jgi:hypothetical protein